MPFPLRIDNSNYKSYTRPTCEKPHRDFHRVHIKLGNFATELRFLEKGTMVREVPRRGLFNRSGGRAVREPFGRLTGVRDKSVSDLHFLFF